jgi:hypothetical protein
MNNVISIFLFFFLGNPGTFYCRNPDAHHLWSPERARSIKNGDLRDRFSDRGRSLKLCGVFWASSRGRLQRLGARVSMVLDFSKNNPFCCKFGSAGLVSSLHFLSGIETCRVLRHEGHISVASPRRAEMCRQCTGMSSRPVGCTLYHAESLKGLKSTQMWPGIILQSLWTYLLIRSSTLVMAQASAIRGYEQPRWRRRERLSIQGVAAVSAVRAF